MPDDHISILFEQLPTGAKYFVNQTGRRFGRWVVIGYAGRDKYTNWWCKCDCGTIRKLKGVRMAQSQSCGCSRKKDVRLVDIPEYDIYNGAKKRCRSKNNKGYKYYGARGIEFRFESFQQFMETVGPRPTLDHSLDRVNNDGHYEPSNCRWATKSEQNLNRRNTTYLTVGDKTEDTFAWAEKYNVPQKRIANRLYRGWCGVCAVFLPLDFVCPHNKLRSRKD